MKFKSRFFSLPGIVLLLLFLPASAWAMDVYSLDRRIKERAESFDLLMDDPQSSIPTSILRKAEGIIILRQYKAGFVFGVKGGRGIAVVKNKKTGKWSPPAFISAGEGSWGLQLGGQVTDTVFLIMNAHGMKLLSSPKFRVGVDVAATAGPHGGGAEAKIGEGTPILVYGNSTGLFAGAAFEGGVLLPDNKANSLYYENPSITMREILFSEGVPNPKAGKELSRMIEGYASGKF